jgi:hypothetical protein
MPSYGFEKWQATPHLWGALAPGIPDDHPIQEQFTENILSFADRHDLTLVMSQWNTTPEDAAALENRLALAADRDINVWLGTYDLRKYTDRELIGDDEKLADDIDRLRRIVDTYAEYYPAGNVFLWHEAPLTGKWTGDTRAEQADSMREFGPELFAAQKRAIVDAHPDLDVGIFIHQPFLAPREYSDKPVFGSIMSDLAEYDALPDFTYFDMYRYHFDWDVGYEGTNDYLEAIFENVKRHTDGRPVYYLADVHSHEDNRTRPDVNPDGENSYTPSKQALLGHLRTARDAGAEAFGWYIGKGYPSQTSPRNYDPFVPERGPVDNEDTFNTITGARDRFVWATLALLERTTGLDPDDRFDLWLSGHDFGLLEHRLELRTADSDWEFVNDFGGYTDGENYLHGGSGRDWTTVIHALDRERFVVDGELHLRVTTGPDSDGSTLEEVAALPHLNTTHYLTERKITALRAEDPDIGRYALGATDLGAELSPGEQLTATVPVDRPAKTTAELALATQRSTLRELRERESESESERSPRELFDLWLYGTDLTGCSVALNGQSATSYRSESQEVDRNREALVFRGLERGKFLEHGPGGEYFDLTVDSTDQAEIAAAYAVPYHGTANFRSDIDVATAVATDYRDGEGQLTTFSLGHQFWPDRADPSTQDGVRTRIHVEPRPVNGFTAFERGD